MLATLCTILRRIFMLGIALSITASIHDHWQWSSIPDPLYRPAMTARASLFGLQQSILNLKYAVQDWKAVQTAKHWMDHVSDITK